MSESDPAGDFDPYTASPQQLVDEFVGLLDVEPIDTDLYRGAQLHGGRGRIFGGQVIAQALAAAEKSVGDDRTPHSLHAYFTRAGDENFPVIYRVTRDRDGRSFSTRRVIAQQKGRPILSMAVNFQVPEEGLHHQFDMPDAPPPEGSIETESNPPPCLEAAGQLQPAGAGSPRPPPSGSRRKTIGMHGKP